MDKAQAVPIVSANAGDPNALADPFSPASLVRLAKKQQTQAAADAKYDAPAPPPAKEGFDTEVIMYYSDPQAKRQREITSGLFMAASILLAMYALAPTGSFPNNA